VVTSRRGVAAAAFSFLLFSPILCSAAALESGFWKAKNSEPTRERERDQKWRKLERERESNCASPYL